MNVPNNLTDPQTTAINAGFAAVNTAFVPFVCNLKNTDIPHIKKLSPAHIAALKEALTFMQQNPGEIAANTDVAGYSAKVDSAESMMELKAQSEQLDNQFGNTLIGMFADGFDQARELYRMQKAKGRTGQNAAFLDAFGTLFPQGPHKTTTTTTPAKA